MRGPCPSAGARRKRRNAGFTLVELLVVLVILGLILAMIAGGVRFGTRAWEVGTARSAAAEEIVGVQSFLRRRIAEARLIPTGEDEPGEAAGFQGEPDRLRLTAPWLSPVGAGALYVFELFIAANGDRRDLALRWGLRHPEWTGTFEPRSRNQRVLLRDIRGLSIRYFGAPNLEGEPAWQTAWADPYFLPRLISIDVALPSGPRRSWPRLIVAPHSFALTP